MLKMCAIVARGLRADLRTFSPKNLALTNFNNWSFCKENSGPFFFSDTYKISMIKGKGNVGLRMYNIAARCLRAHLRTISPENLALTCKLKYLEILKV